ncbi:MAG: flagellar filament capping protein FliD [Selenomonadaceae bacterium]|nr:flagellar filament capping protein FliD [Selenomonadaceae bacterium]
MGSNGIYGVSGSGLDIESMVKVGMMGKQNEYDKMQQKFTVNEWTKEKYLETYGTLMTFNNSTLSQYKMSSNMNARSAHSSNELALSAAANATAANMTHYVEVQGLASAAYLIGAHGDNGVKTHNVGSTESIKLADALFASVAEGSQVTDIINNRVTTYSKIVADGKEFNPNDIAFQFSVGDGVTGITNSNPEVVSVSAAIGAEKGTHTVTVNKETASVSLNSVDLARITHYDDVGIANDSTESNEEFDEQIKNIAFKYKSTGADDSTITFGNLNYITDRDDFVTMMINQYPDELRRIIPNFENLDVADINRLYPDLYDQVSDTINAASTYTTLANDEETLAGTNAISFTLSDGFNSAEITFNYLEIMQGTATISELNRRISAAGLNIESSYEVGGELTLRNTQPGSENKISITVAANEENNPVGTNTAAFLNAMGLTNSVTQQQYGSTGAPAYAAGETLTASGADVTMTVDGVTVPMDGDTATVDGVTYTALGTGEATVGIDHKVISVTYQQLLDGYTFNDLAAAVNSLGTNVRASYDSVQDSFSFYNSESGSKNGVTLTMASNTDDDNIGDRTAQFFTNLGLQKSSRGVVSEDFDSTFHAGETKMLMGDNASVKIDGVSYDDLDSNKATVNGVIYNFNQITTEPVTVTITQDVDKIVSYVKSFVEDYNKLISGLQDLYHEKSNDGYLPLTDAQRAEMKDEQIEKWEKKAKEGLLYHDSTIGRIIDKMRDAISQRVEGIDSKYNTVYSLGISSAGTRGQLTLDEEKLRTALADDPNAVYNIFAKLDKDDDASGNGVAQRLGDVLSNGLKAIRTRAGSSSDISEDSDLNNLLRELQVKMSNFKIMMNAYEEALYKKYDAMESSLAVLGAQLNYVTGAFNS